MNRPFILSCISILLISSLGSAQNTNHDSLQGKWDAELERMRSARSYDQSRESLREAFAWLKIVDLGRSIVAFDSTVSTLFNIRRADLDHSDPLFIDDALGAYDILVLQTRLSPVDPRKMYLLFSEGPSGDPSFYFVDPEQPDQIWDELWGTALAIPGNGIAYVASRSNNTFTERRKYIYGAMGFHEVNQPFMYVGLKTHTLKAISLMAEPNSEKVVAQLSQGSAVEVLIADPKHAKKGNTLLLVRTPFGLTGWIEIEITQYYSDVIEGISFWGD